MIAKKLGRSHQLSYLVERLTYRRIRSVVEKDDCVLSMSDFVRQAIRFNLNRKYAIEVLDLIPFEQRESITQADVLLIMLNPSQKQFTVSDLRKMLIRPDGETRKKRRKQNESMRKILKRMIDKKLVVKKGIVAIPTIGSNQASEYSSKTMYAIYSLSPEFEEQSRDVREIIRITLRELKQTPQQCFSRGRLQFKAEIQREYFRVKEWNKMLELLYDLRLIKKIVNGNDIQYASLRYSEREYCNGSKMITLRISEKLSLLLKDLGILENNKNKRRFLLESINVYLREFSNEYFLDLRPLVVKVGGIIK